MQLNVREAEAICDLTLYPVSSLARAIEGRTQGPPLLRRSAVNSDASCSRGAPIRHWGRNERTQPVVCPLLIGFGWPSPEIVASITMRKHQ
jgi:hypothetical protein